METKYPECEKMSRCTEKSQICGEFLEWLLNKYCLAKWTKTDNSFNPEELVPVNDSIENILADFFEIDLKLVEKEKIQVLEEIRKVQRG
jgi:hypothetical protein